VVVRFATRVKVRRDEGGSEMGQAARDLPHPRHSTTGSAERPPQDLDAPILRFKLADEIALVRQDVEFKQNGHSAKVLVKDGETRLVLIAIEAGAHVPDYQVEHRVAIEALTGQVNVVTPTQSIALSAGELVSLGAEIAHRIEAREDSAVLLTFAWNESERSSQSHHGFRTNLES